MVNEAEKQSRVLRVKFNKKFINRSIIYSKNGKTFKGKILEVLDHETFSIQNQSHDSKPVEEVDIYDIYRVI